MEKRKAEGQTMKGQVVQDAAQDRTAIAQTMGAPGAFPKRLRRNRRIGLLALLGAGIVGMGAAAMARVPAVAGASENVRISRPAQEAREPHTASATSTASSASRTTVAAEANGGAAAAGAHVVTFKLAMGDAQGGTQWELAKAFRTAFERRTGGHARVTVFPNGQLGSEEDTVNNAALGTLSLSVLAINNLAPFSPSLGVLTLPYVIRSADEARTLVEGDIGRQLVENTVRDAQVRIVGWAFSGFRVLTSSRRPVVSLDDLQGQVIRVPKNRVMIETWRAWGINPSPLAWSETFTALQQRVVDGQDNPYTTVAAMRFDEVQKYITPIHYLFSLEPLIVSEAVFRKQPPEVQQALLDAGREATAHSFRYLQETEHKVRDQLQARGMQIVQPADGERKWIELAQNQVWPKFYDAVGGRERVEATQRALGR
jgi:tripartite ATP-independent periplasmic transporter solute receptor, DctP family